MKLFESPELLVSAFEIEDIITTSGIGDKIETEDDFNGGAIH